MPIVDLFVNLLFVSLFLWSGAINKPAKFRRDHGCAEGAASCWSPYMFEHCQEDGA